MLLCLRSAELAARLGVPVLREGAFRQIGGMCHSVIQVLGTSPYVAGRPGFGLCECIHQKSTVFCPFSRGISINPLHITLLGVLAMLVILGS
jgi:hypothetical protein